MKDLLLAAAILLIASAGILAWQWRTAKEDRHSAALRAANRGRGRGEGE
jgi:hypothetical protein